MLEDNDEQVQAWWGSLSAEDQKAFTQRVNQRVARMKEWANSEEGKKRNELLFSRKAPVSGGVLIGPVREDEEE